GNRGQLLASTGGPLTLFRLGSNGTLDTSFGNNGSLTETDSTGSRLALLPDQTILVLSLAGASADSATAFLKRFDPSGQPDGTFVAAGSANEGGSTVISANAFALARYIGASGPSVQLSAPTYTAEEASGAVATITVTRSGDSSGAVSVHYATSNGTAQAG